MKIKKSKASLLEHKSDITIQSAQNHKILGAWGGVCVFFLAYTLSYIIYRTCALSGGISWLLAMVVVGVVVSLIFPQQIRLVNFTISLRPAIVALIIGVIAANFSAFVQLFTGPLELIPHDVLTVLRIVILVPIVEEYFIRGLIFNSFLQRWPTVVAVLITSILFASGHDSFWVAFTAELILCTLFLLFRRSLTVSIIAHCGLNIAATFPSWLIFRSFYIH